MAGGSPRTIKVNRAPVLTLWAAVVAERLGFTHDDALALGRAVAGLNAYSKGVSLGLIHPAPEAVHEERKKLQKGKTLTVALLGGRRALTEPSASPSPQGKLLSRPPVKDLAFEMDMRGVARRLYL